MPDKVIVKNENPKQASLAKPIEYFGGVMDEETRPLLKQTIQDLGENEGVLVIFRKPKDSPTDILLESNITQMSGGHGWHYVTGNDGSGPMQTLIEGLSEQANTLRLPIAMYQQGGQKIKADDETTICFGIIGKTANANVTSIKTIVHQQLNMGLNGDLVLHEGDVLMQAMLDNKVFHDENNRQRAIHVRTYGAGGSASNKLGPGQMAVSDAVIDIRSHIDPICLLDYMNEKVKKDPNNPNYLAYSEMENKIRQQCKEEKNFTGINMVHQVAQLARLAATAGGYNNVNELMKNMDRSKLVYYGEITLATPMAQGHTIYRVTHDKNGKPFVGNNGQAEALKHAKDHMVKIGEAKINPEGISRPIEERQIALEAEINRDAALAAVKRQLIVASLPPDVKVIYDDIAKTFATLTENRYAASNHLLELEHEYRNADEERRASLSGVIQELTTVVVETEQLSNAAINQLVQILDDHTNLADQVQLAELNKSLLDNTSRIAKLGDELSDMRAQQREIFASVNLLNNAIQDAKDDCRELYGDDYQFNMTGCGGIFFGENDKEAMTRFGANLVEMENSLFLQIINHNIANNVFIAEQYITKLAADPKQIDRIITNTLNQWATNHRMTIDDYVDAFMWFKDGQPFDNRFPNSGRWTVAEQLYKDNEFLREKFYNFNPDDPSNPKVVNPFWKEIGTDLIKEMIGGLEKGAAFNKDFGFDHGNTEVRKKAAELSERAKAIMSNMNEWDRDKLKSEVRSLFQDYLNLSKIPKNEVNGVITYGSYARKQNMGITWGYVGNPPEGTPVSHSTLSPVSDWDPYIYKSTNTAVLDVAAARFVQEQAKSSASKATTKNAVVTSSEQAGTQFTNINDSLLAARKAFSSKNYQEVINLWNNYNQQLSGNPNMSSGDKKDYIRKYEYFRNMAYSATNILQPAVMVDNAPTVEKPLSPQDAFFAARREVYASNFQAGLDIGKKYFDGKDTYQTSSDATEIAFEARLKKLMNDCESKLAPVISSRENATTATKIAVDLMGSGAMTALKSRATPDPVPTATTIPEKAAPTQPQVNKQNESANFENKENVNPEKSAPTLRK